MTSVVGHCRISARVLRLRLFLELDDVITKIGFDDVRCDLTRLQGKCRILKRLYHTPLLYVRIKSALLFAFRIFVARIFAKFISQGCKIFTVFRSCQNVFSLFLFL